MTFIEGLAEALCVSDGGTWPPDQQEWERYIAKAQEIAEFLHFREEASIVSDNPWTSKRRVVVGEHLLGDVNVDETVPGDRIEYRYVSVWRQW